MSPSWDLDRSPALPSANTAKSLPATKREERGKRMQEKRKVVILAMLANEGGGGEMVGA
jgi:hypothetical protein